MTRTIGTAAYGLRAPIIKEGDDIVKIVTDTVLNSGLTIKDRDVIGITESLVARALGKYVTVDEITEEVRRISNNAETIFVDRPVYSRNRFAMILKAIARAAGKKVIIGVTDIDEVGNVIRNHPFTGMNYDDYYKEIVENEGKECEIVNIDKEYLEDVENIEGYRIDARMYRTTKDISYDLNEKCGLQHICCGTGKNQSLYGLHGTNKSNEETLKLFPDDCCGTPIVNRIADNIKEATGKNVSVMLFGDGGFKCPVSGIWECLDPVVSPAYTRDLEGTPNEIKIKNFADEKYKDLSGEELNEAVKEEIKQKESNLVGTMTSQGTTPRKYTDLLGSLSDLISASGDKGTPIVYIQGYFDNYADE